MCAADKYVFDDCEAAVAGALPLLLGCCFLGDDDIPYVANSGLRTIRGYQNHISDFMVIQGLHTSTQPSATSGLF